MSNLTAAQSVITAYAVAITFRVRVRGGALLLRSVCVCVALLALSAHKTTWRHSSPTQPAPAIEKHQPAITTTTTMASTTAHASVPGFYPSKPRYDQTTFAGRFKHFMDIADPRCLAPGLFFGMPLNKSRELMQQYKANRLPTGVNADTMWLAKKVHDSAIHPDTGEVILQPFRMSGFAVYGTPIVVAMLLPNPTLARTIIFQALNQTHNACVNYSNRNASQPTKVSDLVTGYLGAVASSVSIAVGLNQAVARANISASARTVLSRFVPYPAVATASTCNMLLMRRSELKTGITVKDHEGNVRGVSKEAAKSAIFQTMLTRIVLPAPLLVIPPALMMVVQKTPLLKRFPRLAIPVESLICVSAFVFGLPFAISLFPQEGSIDAASAEADFHNLRDSEGRQVTTLYYNKGL